MLVSFRVLRERKKTQAEREEGRGTNSISFRGNPIYFRFLNFFAVLFILGLIFLVSSEYIVDPLMENIFEFSL